MTGLKLKINLIYHKNIYLFICLLIACNIIILPIINQFHIALQHECHHHIQHGLTDAFHEQYILSRSDGDNETSNACCPFCLQLHALNNTIIIEALQNVSLLVLQCLEFIHIDYYNLFQFPFVIITNQRSPPF